MKTKHTDKQLLSKGIQQMLLTVILMFAGPTLLYIALSSKEKQLYIPLLLLALIICAFAIYSGFKGIKIILDSMFKKH